MGVFRFLFMPEFNRPLGLAKASLGRSGGWLRKLGPALGADRIERRPWKSRRGMAATAAGLGMAFIGTALVVLAGRASLAQGIDASLFETVDEASRDLVRFLRGGEAAGNTAWSALGDMVWYFSAGLLVFAAVLFVYHVVAEMMDMGWEGRVRMRGREVVRIVAAVALLWPLPGGPGGGQHVVLDLAGLGGDFAQAVWKPFAGTVLGSSKVSAPKPPAEGRKLTMVDLLVANVCVQMAGSDVAAGPRMQTERGGELWLFEVAKGRKGYDIRSHCGQVKFSGLDRDGPRGELARAHLEGMKKAQEVLAPVAREIGGLYEQGQNFGEPMDPVKVAEGIETAVAAYGEIVDRAVENAKATFDSETAEELRREVAEQSSWTTAGSVFNTIARKIGEFNWAVVSGPEVTPPVLALKDQDRKTFKALGQVADGISTAVGSPVTPLGSRAPGVGAGGGGVSGLLSDVFYSLLFSFENVLDVQGDNPIAELSAIGHNLVTAVLLTSGTLMTVATVSNLGDASVMGFSAKADLFEATWPVIDGLVTSLLMVMLIGGAVLAWLVPALPFIRFLFGVLIWILCVVEAFIAMSVWLAAQTARTDEGGLLTNTTVAGLVTLVGVVLRPPIMVLGLVIGYLVFTVTIDLFNEIWLPQMRDASGEVGAGLIQYAVFLALYVMIAYALLNGSLKLIEMLPDAVMTWIGGRAAGVSGADQMIGVATGGAGRLGGVAPSRMGGGARNRGNAGSGSD
ncbi:MAG: DotA/TraY family protein [Gemmatimonadetes bacterium]|nr:DotA/TraY family protein [Gemmatimonadota bacterium]